MAYFHNQGAERLFFPGGDAGYAVSAREEAWIGRGIVLLIAGFWVAILLSGFLVLRGLFDSFPPLPDDRFALGYERWRYLIPFLGGWVLVWFGSALFWSRVSGLLENRERVVIHDLGAMSGRLAHQMLKSVRPTQILVIAVILGAFLFQSFGDICFLFRGVGNCEIVTIDLNGSGP